MMKKVQEKMLKASLGKVKAMGLDPKRSRYARVYAGLPKRIVT